MKTRAFSSRAGGRRCPRLRDEDGMILAITMLILLVLSTLAASTLVNAFLERSLSRNQVNANIAQNAADAGIAAGIAWLNDPATNVGIPDYTTTPGWTVNLAETLPNVGTSTASGAFTDNAASPASATYETTIRFRREGDVDAQARCDVGGCGDNEVILYNRCTAGPVDNCWGYTDSAYSNPGGWPVMVVRSAGRYGVGGIRTVEMEVARDKFSIRATGAVTAASNLTATGNITIDGRSHDINGNLGGNCTTAFPGVSIPPPVWDQNGDGTCNCTDGTASPCTLPAVVDRGCYTASQDGTASVAGDPTPTATNNTVPPLSPDAALGLDEGDLARKLGGTLPAPGNFMTKGNITYYNRDYDMDTGGTGVIIVHNPLFESAKYHWSDPVGEAYRSNFYDAAGTAIVSCVDRKALDGGGNPVYPDYDGNLDSNCPGNFVPDATYATQNAYRDAHKPRNLEQHGNNTFKGAIIADKVDKINGSADIIGAMISLSTVSTNILGNGAARILYSCDALSLYTDVGYSIKLSWHRIR